MPALLLVSALCALVMVGGLLRMLRPPRAGVHAIRAVAAAVGAAVLTAGVGGWLRADTPEFLVASSAAVAPLAVLLGVAAEEAAPVQPAAGWWLVGLWSLLVYPVCAIVPPLLLAGCAASECRVADFAGGLPLLASSAAMLLVAGGRPSGPHPLGMHHVGERPGGWRRLVGPVLLIWAAAALWIASLEGVVDAYTPRILLATVVSPLGGAVGWLLADLVRGARRHPVHSATGGVLAGLAAILPGAAGISAPWSMLVGGLAGAVCALILGSRRLAARGRAGRVALGVLAATGIGYLAPAVAGDTLGFIFSGRMGALVPPAIVYTAVVAFGALVALPLWLGIRAAARRSTS